MTTGHGLKVESTVSAWAAVCMCREEAHYWQASGYG